MGSGAATSISSAPSGHGKGVPGLPAGLGTPASPGMPLLPAGHGSPSAPALLWGRCRSAGLAG